MLQVNAVLAFVTGPSGLWRPPAKRLVQDVAEERPLMFVRVRVDLVHVLERHLLVWIAIWHHVQDSLNGPNGLNVLLPVVLE